MGLIKGVRKIRGKAVLERFEVVLRRFEGGFISLSCFQSAILCSTERCYKRGLDALYVSYIICFGKRSESILERL